MASGNYRADHIGSLLPALRRDGGPDPGNLIGDVELQLSAVMDVFTDGEPWRADDGGAAAAAAGLEAQLAARFDGEGGGELTRLRVAAPSWAKLKTALPMPVEAGHQLVLDCANELLREGVDYLQFDARHYAQMFMRAAGGNGAASATAAQLELDRELLAGLETPEGVSVGVYLGEAGEGLAALHRGGQDDLLERLFGLPAKRFLIGMGLGTELGFVAHAPAERLIVLGLIDPGTGELEQPDDVLARVDVAAEIHGDLLAVAPSRGFADAPGSAAAITLHDQRKKLELVSDVARMFWGTEL